MVHFYICDMETIGQTLQNLRESRRFSGNTLAKAANLSVGTYFDIERNHREASFIVIVRICRFYKISLQSLIEMIDPMEFERRELSSIRMREKRNAKTH